MEQPKHADLPYTIEQVEGRIEALKAEVEAILTAPPPKPKEEPKKEEAKDGAAGEDKEAAGAENGEGQPAAGDAEMKDEEQPAAEGNPEGSEKPADVDMDAGAGESSGQAQE